MKRMRLISTHRQADVVLVPLLFSEGRETKKRPALVITTEEYHRHHQEVVILAITSNVKRVLFGDTVIDNWKEAGLVYPSLVAGILQTIKQNMILRKLGTLSEQDFHNVQPNLRKSIGL